MKFIKLHNKRLITVVDDEDYEWLSKHRCYAKEGTNTFYAVNNISGHATQMPRMILGIIEDRKVFGDHKDLYGLNNQRSNLRIATKSENTVNRNDYKNCNGYRGVRHQGRKFIARTCKDGVEFTIDCKSIEEAALMYNVLALRHHGKFAILNKIPIHRTGKAILDDD